MLESEGHRVVDLLEKLSFQRCQVTAVVASDRFRLALALPDTWLRGSFRQTGSVVVVQARVRLVYERCRSS